MKNRTGVTSPPLPVYEPYRTNDPVEKRVVSPVKLVEKSESSIEAETVFQKQVEAMFSAARKVYHFLSYFLRLGC